MAPHILQIKLFGFVFSIRKISNMQLDVAKPDNSLPINCSPDIGDLTEMEKMLIVFKRLNMTQAEAARRLGMSRPRFNINLNRPRAPLHFERKLYGLYRRERLKQQRAA